MYKSEKVANHIESCKFTGTADKPLIQATFYVTPLKYDLLYEIDDRIAKTLFRKEGKDHVPVAELGKSVLNLGTIPAHNLEIFPHDQKGADDAGQMIPYATIGEVYCDKLFTDDPNWSLIWKASFGSDKHSIELLRTYFKKTCFITLVEAQQELIETKPKAKSNGVTIIDDATVESPRDILCAVCNKLATYLAEDQSGFCDGDVSAAVGANVRRLVYVSGL